MSDTPERDALRAECEAKNLRCPSCRVLWADLPADHQLAMLGPLKCKDGQPVAQPADFTTFRLAVNTQALDEYRRGMDAALGPMPA